MARGLAALSREEREVLERLDVQALPDEEQLRAEEARRHFRLFIAYAWDVIEPDAPFVPSREIDAIAIHLEAVTYGHIQDLAINVRPRASKSRVASVLWPVWDWLHLPTRQFLTASFDLSLALEHSGLARKLMESDWFRQRYGYIFPVEPRVSTARRREDGRLPSPLARNKNGDGWYANTAGGTRRIVSPRSGTTGRGGSRLIFDDPHDAQKVESTEEREKTVRWMRRAFFTRRNNERRDARVVLGQRTHHADAFAYIYKSERSFTCLVLPTEYNPSRRRPATEIGWEDPRTEPGELLANPLRFGQPENAAAKITLGEDYSAQHDQEPTPSGGSTFQVEDLRRWRYQDEELLSGVVLSKEDGLGRLIRLIPRAGPNGQDWARFFDDLCQSWDFTFKGTPDADMVVGQLWGRKGPDFFLLYQARARLDFPACLALMKHIASLYPAVFTKLVEDAAAGPGIVDMLRASLMGLELVGTKNKGKTERARAVAPFVRGGNVYVPEEHVVWGTDSTVPLFTEELRAFPRGTHDDQVDAMSQALMHLFKSYQGWLQTLALTTGSLPPGAAMGFAGLPG